MPNFATTKDAFRIAYEIAGDGPRKQSSWCTALPRTGGQNWKMSEWVRDADRRRLARRCPRLQRHGASDKPHDDEPLWRPHGRTTSFAVMRTRAGVPKADLWLFDGRYPAISMPDDDPTRVSARLAICAGSRNLLRLESSHRPESPRRCAPPTRGDHLPDGKAFRAFASQGWPATGWRLAACMSADRTSTTRAVEGLGRAPCSSSTATRTPSRRRASGARAFRRDARATPLRAATI